MAALVDGREVRKVVLDIPFVDGREVREVVLDIP